MKKSGTLNQALSATIAGLGHTDTLVIADAGLPIPAATQRIDLALAAGIPAFLDTLRVVLRDMEVERAIVAEEITHRSPQLLQEIRALLGDITLELISHETFKQQTATARAVVRTGEFTPYANIILVSGVVF